ncbi:MAG: hypothetical protein ACMXX7_00680 [Candidatus Woesearchaeota archaeon]
MRKNNENTQEYQSTIGKMTSKALSKGGLFLAGLGLGLGGGLYINQQPSDFEDRLKNKTEQVVDLENTVNNNLETIDNLNQKVDSLKNIHISNEDNIKALEKEESEAKTRDFFLLRGENYKSNLSQDNFNLDGDYLVKDLEGFFIDAGKKVEFQTPNGLRIDGNKLYLNKELAGENISFFPYVRGEDGNIRESVELKVNPTTENLERRFVQNEVVDTLQEPDSKVYETKEEVLTTTNQVLTQEDFTRRVLDDRVQLYDADSLYLATQEQRSNAFRNIPILEDYEIIGSVERKNMLEESRQLLESILSDSSNASRPNEQISTVGLTQSAADDGNYLRIMADVLSTEELSESTRTDSIYSSNQEQSVDKSRVYNSSFRFRGLEYDLERLTNTAQRVNSRLGFDSQTLSTEDKEEILENNAVEESDSLYSTIQESAMRSYSSDTKVSESAILRANSQTRLANNINSTTNNPFNIRLPRDTNQLLNVNAAIYSGSIPVICKEPGKIITDGNITYQNIANKEEFGMIFNAMTDEGLYDPKEISTTFREISTDLIYLCKDLGVEMLPKEKVQNIYNTRLDL